jgi:hypothetical protein
MMQWVDYEMIAIVGLTRPFRAQMVFLTQPRPMAWALAEARRWR